MVLAAGHLLHTASASSRGQGSRYYGDLLRFKEFGLVGLWDTRRRASITLNGTDVANLASLVPGGLDLPQATPANQPLYTGAPAFNGWPSIQFVATNGDTLVKTGTNPIGAGPYSLVLLHHVRNTATCTLFSTINNAGTGGVLVQVTSALRGVTKVGAGGQLATGTPSTTVPEVWIITMAAGAEPTLSVNAATPVTGGTNPGITDPGGAGNLSIGSAIPFAQNADEDFLCAALFANVLTISAQVRISHALGPAAGIAA